jgi:jacalin-like lectin domain-containing protein
MADARRELDETIGVEIVSREVPMGRESGREQKPPKGALGAPAAALLDGYDSVSGELRASALTATPHETGSTIYAHIAVCEGMTELTEALNVDQSLSIEFGEIGKIEEKLEFARKQKATTESLSIVVHARYQAKQISAKEPKFKVALDPKKLGDFVSAYGDSYVDSVTLGGEYYAVYTFHTQTSEDQKDLKLQLDAKGVKAGNSIEAKVVAELHQFATNSKTAWTFDQRLSGVKADLPKHEEMVDFVTHFPSKDFSNPVVVGRSTAHYENVSMDSTVREAFQPVMDNRNYFIGSGGGGLARSLVKIAARRNKVEWIQAIHACYGFSGDSKLADLKKELETDREAIRAQLLEYRKNPLQKFTPPPLPSLAKGTPMLQFEKGMSDQWGKKTGSWRFDYFPVEQALQSRTRLAWVQLRASNFADIITMVYRDSRGDSGPWHIGGDGGGGVTQNALSFDSNEWVKKVNVRHGDIIDQLEIITTAGGRTSAGGSGGAPASFEATDGRVILGFQGTGGVDIQTLQVVWVKLLNSTYVS